MRKLFKLFIAKNFYCDMTYSFSVAFISICLLSLTSLPVSAKLKNNNASNSSKPNGVIDQISRELYSKSFEEKFCNEHPLSTLGIWTISAEKSPLDIAATKRIYEELLSSLLKNRPKCINIIDSAAVGLIAEHLNKSGAIEESGGNVLAALTYAHQSVDMLIFPELYTQGGNVLMSMRIVEQKSAQTLYSTKPIALPKTYLFEGKLDEALPLDKAIKAASSQFLKNASDLNEIQSGGIFYEGSGAQTEVGRYIGERLIAALSEQSVNSISGKALKVRGISLETNAQETTSAAELDSDTVARNANIYTLTGRYWQRDKFIDLQVSLKRPDGGTISWSGPIKIADLNGLDLVPKNPASLENPVLKSSVAFQVTTPQGISPTYRAGDTLQLLIRAAREAWLYCFYIDSKGDIETIFPLPQRLAAGRSAHLAPNRLIRLPDSKKDNFNFRFNNKTTGEELVSCFAANRDIRADLPSSLFPEQISPIPFLTLKKLHEIFGAVDRVQITEALVTISLTP